MKHNFFPLKGVDMNSLNDLPIPSGYEVYWEPWIDAYDNEDISNAKKLFEEEAHDLEEIEKEGAYETEHGSEEELYNDFAMFQKPIRTIITPFGVLPLTESCRASSHFKFWVGHSNFKLLDGFHEIIEACNGVESLDILTPYRFRVSIGKLFVDRDVMHEVRTTLLGVVNEPKE